MLTPNFHWIRVAALRLRSSFAPPSGNPHRLRFESATAQYGRQLASGLGFGGLGTCGLGFGGLDYGPAVDRGSRAADVSVLKLIFDMK